MADHIASELLDDVPAVLGDLIGAVGRGVADAQHALDAAAVERLTAIATADGAVAETLRAIGYRPTWYRIPELDAEVTVSLTLAGRSEQSGRTGALQLYATPVDASFSNKYVVNAEVATRIRFKVLPVPPSPLAAELVVVPPDLVGLSWAAASAALTALGVPFERDTGVRDGADPVDGEAPADSDPVTETRPPSRSVLAPGETLLVSTRKPNRGDA